MIRLASEHYCSWPWTSSGVSGADLWFANPPYEALHCCRSHRGSETIGRTGCQRKFVINVRGAETESREKIRMEDRLVFFVNGRKVLSLTQSSGIFHLVTHTIIKRFLSCHSHNHQAFSILSLTQSSGVFYLVTHTIIKRFLLLLTRSSGVFHLVTHTLIKRFPYWQSHNHQALSHTLCHP